MVSLNFSAASQLSPVLLRSLQLTLIWYIENKSAQTAIAFFDRMKHFLRLRASNSSDVIGQIQVADILNYKASLAPKDASFLGTLRTLFYKWNELRLPGLPPETIRFLRILRVSAPQKGRAVLTSDPYNGPYSEVEFQALNATLNNAYSKNVITTDDYLISKLSFNLGLRPAQISLLKVCDVKRVLTKDATVFYFLHVPRIKQGNPPRTELTPRRLLRLIGEQLLDHTDVVRERFRGIIEEPQNAPLFPGHGLRRGKRPPGLEFHSTAPAMGVRIKRRLEELEVYSERTGARLHVTATRQRRTYATRLRELGAGELTIAAGLDQSSTEYVHVYAQATPNLMDSIDKATAMLLAPLAQAFLGKVISGQADATRCDDPTCQINDPQYDQVQGCCASSQSCRLMKPAGCYACPSFEPWADGPHEKVLDVLLSKRETLVSGGCIRLAKNLDRAILACAETVIRCRKRHV